MRGFGVSASLPVSNIQLGTHSGFDNIFVRFEQKNYSKWIYYIVFINTPTKYAPMKSTPCDIPDVSWIIDGPTLESFVWNTGTFIDAHCDKYHYQVDSDGVTAKSHEQLVDVGDMFCCGCLFPNDYSYRFDKPKEIKTEGLAEGETPFSAIMKVFVEISRRDHIGRLIFRLHSDLDKQNGDGYTRNMILKPLKDAKFDVSLLELNFMRFKGLDVTPFLEFILFKHLIVIAEEPLRLTEKILNSELLFLDVPIANIEELDQFKGIALLLGKKKANNFSLDMVCEQIEKYMEDIPSKIEFFAVYDLDDWVTEEMIERLRLYSVQTDNDFSRPKSKTTEAILRLDMEDNAAILIRGGQNVVFVRNGWRKWQELLEQLWLQF